MKVHPKNIIVSGTPGSWGNACAQLLAQQGWKVLWPNQDLDIRDGRHYLSANYQNIEVENIHRCIESDFDCSNFSLALPAYYDVPYPGPAEFISKFQGEAVVVSGRCLAPCLDMWKPVASIVVDIQATEQEDLTALVADSNQWHRAAISEEQAVSIRQYQLDKYRTHLKLFSKVFTISNAEVKDQRFDVLSDFLNSVF
jgi:hypothetical protein